MIDFHNYLEIFLMSPPGITIKEHNMAEEKAKQEQNRRQSIPGEMPSPPEPTMGGYNCKILRVNLTQNTALPEPLAYELARKYIGGAGFVAHFLWKEMKPGTDALSPGNILVFALGPVTGLSLPGASRYCAGAKSPLTGGIAKAESGGFWMADLKRAGYDAIVIEGKAPRPVYLWIHDGVAEIKDAFHLWGKETKETQQALRDQLGDQAVKVACIGPGGENLVRYACIMTGCYDAAGRGGLGAVMGSKNLKAIAVRGHKMPPVINEEYVKTLRQELISHPHHLSEYGTGGPEMMMQEQSGDLPVRNQRDGLFPNVKLVNGVVLKETIGQKMEGCFACNVRCKKVVKFDEPYSCDPDYGGPEYETLGALGPNCGVDDLKAVCKGNERCNALGLDSISAGSSIAFAMECNELGLLAGRDTNGLELKFGSAAGMLKALDMIAHRQGIGDFMAEGSLRMARTLGHGSEGFAMTVKGLDAAMHDPRGGLQLRIGYMLNPHGADHCSVFGGGTSPFGLSDLNKFGILEPVKDEINAKRLSLFKLNHLLNMVNDYLVICLMPNINNEQKLELVKAVTGWNTSWVEMLQVSERILTLMRLFNLREGLTAADDELPERYYQPKTDGALAIKAIPDRTAMEKARQWYYYYMGWDKNGVPTPEKLAELGLSKSS
jgi:aldehyde:ferredoxin oxidoreductase